MPQRVTRPTILLAALAVLFASCSGNDQSAPTTASPQATVAVPRTATATSTAAGAAPATATTPATTAGRAAPVRQVAPFDPGSFTLSFQETGRGFKDPTWITHAGDGSGRLFVLERAGIVRVLENGGPRAEPFLDIRSLVKAGGEQGLLGLAFHPRFAENGRLFVYYTARTDKSDNTLAEYRVVPGSDRADPASGRVLFAVPDFAVNHNGGMLTFGPDGYLYIGMGDGGGGGDPQKNGQNTNAMLGKIHRIDVNSGDPYGIPADNPFAQGGGRPEVWAYGLRNPWRFSFDRVTNDMWIGDVGQGQWEEINFAPAGMPGGRNYGWSVLEGTHCYGRSECDSAAKEPPVFEYGHEGGNCSVTGGYVYRGAASPVLVGAYLFADYCSGRFWALARDGGVWRATELLKAKMQPSTFGEDEAGELYVADIGGGSIYRLVATPR